MDKLANTRDSHDVQVNEKALSFDEVMAMAQSLSTISRPDEIKSVLNATALAQLEPLEDDMVVFAITAATKLPKKTLRQQLRLMAQQLGLAPNDLALEIARTVLEERFEGGTHLLRLADGNYMRFISTHWEATTDEYLHNLILEDASKAIAKLESGNLASFVGQIKRCLDFLLGTDEDVMNYLADPLPVINCLNYEVWLGVGGSVSLMPHRPESRLTYCLPVEFDSAVECPLYDSALLNIFAKADDPEDMARHWNELLGYAIQPVRDIPSWWLLIGHGSNGKTKLIQTMQRLVSPGAVLNDQVASFQRDRFNVAALVGKLLFIDDDLAEDVELADGLLKKISEQKEVSARHPYGRRKFNFRSLALVIMAGNSFPLTRDLSHGMERRAHIVPFDRRFTDDEADPNLFPMIWEKEMPGVLSRALEGLQRLRKRGGFKLPSDCERARTEFFTQANSLSAFIKECCIQAPKYRVRLMDMRAAMKVWARDQGALKVPADNRLKRKLEGLGFEVKKVQGYATVYGLSLKP